MCFGLYHVSREKHIIIRISNNHWNAGAVFDNGTDKIYVCFFIGIE